MTARSVLTAELAPTIASILTGSAPTDSGQTDSVLTKSALTLKFGRTSALLLGGLALTAVGLVMPVRPAVADAARLTFPPTSDCAFLGGDAQKRCETRRAGAADEVAKVRSGEIKSAPAPLSSSGGTFQPLSNSGSLGGIGESSTIAPAEDVPARSQPYNPNSIGNPWAGTPYDSGTGTPPR